MYHLNWAHKSFSISFCCDNGRSLHYNNVEIKKIKKMNRVGHLTALMHKKLEAGIQTCLIAM